MKKRKSIIDVSVEKQSGGCCSPQTTVENETPCCEQPTDTNTSCCDKNESKEVNSLMTGCC